MLRTITILLLLVVVFSGCGIAAPGATTAPQVTPTPQLANELTIYHFVDGMSQSILDAFTEEYGVTIKVEGFSLYEEASESIRAGNVYDVVWLSNVQTGNLLAENRLMELNYNNIPNARNIISRFRSLPFDPDNKHNIPWTWGTSGIVYRTDLVEAPLTKWADLWTLPQGKVGIWDDKRALIGMVLRSLGYSVNTTDPAQLEEAYQKLVELRDRGAYFLGELDGYTSAPDLANGDIYAALGWAYDGRAGRELNPEIDYVLPEEGSVLWLESMVIPANSPNQYTAELFINFMLRPENAAQFVNDYSYAVTVEPARELVTAEILNDTAIFPTTATLANAELVQPLPEAAQALYDDVWNRFMEAMENPAAPVPESTAETTPEATPES